MTTPPRALLDRPVIRSGIYAWALVGILLLLVAAGVVVGQISLVAIPLALALFPAAVLYPAARWLKKHGFPDAGAAALVLVGFIAVVAGIIAFVVPQVTNEVDNLSTSLQQGIEQLRQTLEDGFLFLPPIDVGQLTDTVLERSQEIVQGEGFRSGALSAATTAGRFLAGLVLALFALFFYLKDGPRIARWVRSLFPQRVRDDVGNVLTLGWSTIGNYFQGQLFVAVVDAFFIGLGLLLLGVPLAIPLAVLVLFGALFPIVGAIFSGGVAVLVALATEGVGTALAVLAIVIGVQQLEGNLLQPIILGRATALHPLAVISALTIGASLLGVLGAFIAVPIAAGVARTAGYLRQRVPG
jgi:putative heme transporter